MRELLSIINIIGRLVFDCHRAVLFNMEFVSPHTEFQDNSLFLHFLELKTCGLKRR
jgi:hypothetical protein